MKRKLSFCLALLCVLPLFACGGGANAGTETTAAVSETTPVETELLRENTPDNLPDDLNYNGANVRFAVRNVDMNIEEVTAEETGDIQDDALYERNLLVEERLNIKISSVVLDSDVTKMMNAVKTSILAAADDYDEVAGVQWRSLPNSLEGCYYNFANAKYIDLEQPWWWNEYIDEVSIGKGCYFFLNGDISLISILNMSAIFFNKRMLNDIGMDYEELYSIVLDGKWNYDKLIELSNKAYVDVNGDGVQDENDIFGMIVRTGTETDHFTFTAGNKMYTRDATTGYPSLNVKTEYFINYMQKLDDMYYHQKGTFVTADEVLMKQRFAEGKSLFLINRFVAYSALREMEDAYGIVPFPKYKDTQETYSALVHDNATLYSVPICAKDIDMSCAVLEAMSAQNYRTVIPAFYETALKVKYQSVSTAGEIMDIIKNNAHTDFCYAYNYALNGAGLMCRTLIAAKSTDLASQWANKEAGAEQGLKDLIAQYEKTVKEGQK